MDINVTSMIHARWSSTILLHFLSQCSPRPVFYACHSSSFVIYILSFFHLFIGTFVLQQWNHFSRTDWLICYVQLSLQMNPNLCLTKHVMIPSRRDVCSHRVDIYVAKIHILSPSVNPYGAKKHFPYFLRVATPDNNQRFKINPYFYNFDFLHSFCKQFWDGVG